MTDRDQSLQKAFDRHFREEGRPPDTDDDPEAAAYETVYAVLEEEPEGHLPENFAEQVADRVGLVREPAMGWAEIFLLLLIIAGAGAGLVWMPPSFVEIPALFAEGLRSLETASAPVRLDVVLATALVLLVTLGLDSLLTGWRPARKTP